MAPMAHDPKIRPTITSAMDKADIPASFGP